MLATWCSRVHHHWPAAYCYVGLYVVQSFDVHAGGVRRGRFNTPVLEARATLTVQYSDARGPSTWRM